MEIFERGLRKGSSIWFHTPSQMARQLLFYPIAVGDYACSANYLVQRECYDSLLLLLVLDGEMMLKQDGLEVAARKGELLLVDCYYKHEYAATKDTHTMWIHFDGGNSKELFGEIIQQKGRKIKFDSEIHKTVYQVLQLVAEGTQETELSVCLYTLLCGLLSAGKVSEQREYHKEEIENSRQFMRQMLEQDLTVDMLAERVSMSTSYFTKVFRQTTGCSPYEYLLRLRLERAKELLRRTKLPVSEVAYRSGFHSDANFIYFFKKETGISPLKFRGMRF